MILVITFGSSSCNVISMVAFLIPNLTNSFTSLARPRSLGCPPNPRHMAHTRLCVLRLFRVSFNTFVTMILNWINQWHFFFAKIRTCSFLTHWVRSKNSFSVLRLWDVLGLSRRAFVCSMSKNRVQCRRIVFNVDESLIKTTTTTTTTTKTEYISNKVTHKHTLCLTHYISHRRKRRFDEKKP